jgi:hypothetical protein
MNEEGSRRKEKGVGGAPYIPDYGGTCWDEVTLVNIVLSDTVLDSWKVLIYIGSVIGYDIYAPSGTIGCQRKTSFTTAFTYGSSDSSEKSGSREPPRTASISACAERCTSGYSAIAIKKVRSAATV